MLIIRPADFKDVPVISEIEGRCFNHYTLGPKSLRRFLSNKTATIFVAEMQNQVCGHLVMLYRKNSTMARLYSIAIDAPYRKSNLGTQLLVEAERYVRERGLSKIILEVSADNDAAKRFYLKHGFNDQTIFHNYYEEGLHAHRMSKHLH